MDKILQTIEAEYQDRISEAQATLSTAQEALNVLLDAKEAEIQKVIAYQKALDAKAEAELVISNTDEQIKTRIEDSVIKIR